MELTEIGKIESPSARHAHPAETRRVESRIVIYEDFAEGLYGLGEWEKIQVIFGFPGPAEYALKCLTGCGEIKGVFATLSPMRPSPIGITAVELLGIEENILRVRGLDAANESPVYDLKPFVPISARTSSGRFPSSFPCWKRLLRTEPAVRRKQRPLRRWDEKPPSP